MLENYILIPIFVVAFTIQSRSDHFKKVKKISFTERNFDPTEMINEMKIINKNGNLYQLTNHSPSTKETSKPTLPDSIIET